MADAPADELQGWLRKRGAVNPTYKKRWFDLTGGKVTYSSKPGARAAGGFGLEGASVATDQDPLSNSPVRLQILVSGTWASGPKARGRMFHLEAEDEETRDRWVAALRVAIEKATAGEYDSERASCKLFEEEGEDAPAAAPAPAAPSAAAAPLERTGSTKKVVPASDAASAPATAVASLKEGASAREVSGREPPSAQEGGTKYAFVEVAAGGLSAADAAALLPEEEVVAEARHEGNPPALLSIYANYNLELMRGINPMAPIYMARDGMLQA